MVGAGVPAKAEPEARTGAAKALTKQAGWCVEAWVEGGLRLGTENAHEAIPHEAMMNRPPFAISGFW
jgi:hypothetical protein